MAGPTDTLNQALGAWQLWDLPQPLLQAPHCGPPLAHGSAHIVYEIHTEPQAALQLVARVRQRATRTESESCAREIEIWSAASAAGCAPRLVYADEIGDVMVCHHANTLDKPPTGLELGTLCQHIHALPPVDHSLELKVEIAGYLETMAPDQRNAWQRVMQQCDAEASLRLLDQDEHYLCHNDLTAGNLMRSRDRLIAIDWEYAAMGSRYFDLAIAGQGLCPDERLELIRSVLADELNLALMSAGQRAASLITALWQNRYEPAAAPNPHTWRDEALAR
jgi:hypothetical protein